MTQPQATGRRLGKTTATLMAGLLISSLLSSCAFGWFGDEEHAEVTKKNGGGTVLIAADKKVCWELEAYDGRINKGRTENRRSDEIDFTEEEEIEEATTHTAEGCGPAEVELDDQVVYGSVALSIDEDDSDAHLLRNFALVMWLTRNAVPRGAFIGKPRPREAYLIYSGDTKTYRGTDAHHEEVADWPFGNVSDMRFSSEESSALRKAGLDPDVVGTTIRPLIEDVMSSDADVPGHQTNLQNLHQSIVAANTVRAIGRREVTRGADRDYHPSPVPAVLAKIKNLESGRLGAGWKPEAKALRRLLANQRLTEIKDDLYAFSGSGDFRAAATKAELLDLIDPSRVRQWRKVRAGWRQRAAVKAAEEAREEAEWDRNYGSGSSGGTFNIPGWACPTRWC